MSDLKILSVEQVAEALNMPISTLRLKIRAKEIIPDGRLNDGKGFYFVAPLIDLENPKRKRVILFGISRLSSALGVHPRTVIARMNTGKLKPDGVLGKGGIQYWFSETVKVLIEKEKIKKEKSKNGK